ncbi:hypothetical protein NP590_14590 [Methylomonas sp. SURF-2]|uniref:Proteinase inhibitor I42 chagasin domain-containing protein n=1 Tax=Methylomonas subterranea TaxID=2952225 RepID=A0ABT1TIN5_9GAMM|nr:hypothetical protein [Methylomonas sp. SURF-2]MCQ8105340.1 hypothetical protein [Methylomonas sp. SURF-2]
MESPKKRVPSVSPVINKGIRYEVLKGAKSRGFSQNGGIIAAINESDGKELWTLTVYATSYDQAEETDVQDIFITRMTLGADGQSLEIENERKKKYVVTLSDQTVTEQ